MCACRRQASARVLRWRGGGEALRKAIARSVGAVRDEAAPSGQVQTWLARGGWPARRGVMAGAVRPRSCARRRAVHLSGLLRSTSQSTRSSSSSSRNVHVCRHASSARCASVDVHQEGNMCSHRTAAIGWTRGEEQAPATWALEIRTLEPSFAVATCNRACMDPLLGGAPGVREGPPESRPSSGCPHQPHQPRRRPPRRALAPPIRAGSPPFSANFTTGWLLRLPGAKLARLASGGAGA